MEQYRESVKKVLTQFLVPDIEKTEEQGSFSYATQKELGKLGLLAPLLPEPYGVNDLLMQTILAEEIGALCCGFGTSSLASTALFGANIARHGNQQQKDYYLPGISNGEKMGCWALTEPAVGSDALAVKTTLKGKGSGYLLSGRKTMITNAPIADYFLVMARYEGSGMEGGAAVLVERGMKGLSTGAPFEKMGNKSSPMGEVILDQVEISPEHILGELGSGFYDMKNSLDIERGVYSALSLGIMRFCLERSVQYSYERQQFGKPINQFQLIQDKIAKMSAAYELCHHYLYYTIDRMNQGLDCNREAAITKYAIAKEANMVANEAVQIHGGYGYMKEYQVERALRDTKALEIGAGTSEIQKLIIAKQTLKKYAP